MKKIKAIKNTVLKAKPVQSFTLNNSQKQSFKKGEEREITDYVKVKNHFQILWDCRSWFVYDKHIEIYDNNRRIYPCLTSIKLDVPYRSQLDNKYHPTGTCNVTSIGMCLEYFGEKPKEGQLEDELYKYALAKGYDYQSPYDLARIVREYGYQDTFREDATIKQVQNWLLNGNPAVIHGYFTRVGHIVTVVGFDKNGFLVHDPYGEWFSTGYRTDLSGAYLHYSYRLIRRVCIPDGDFWVHFISK